MNDTISCKTCRYYCEIVAGVDLQGWCRRYPPQKYAPVTVNQDIAFEWSFPGYMGNRRLW